MKPGGRGARRRPRVVERTWPAAHPNAARAISARDDIVREQPIVAADGTTTFDQVAGPFTVYRRTVRAIGGTVSERTEYRYDLPWFAAFLALPVRLQLARRGRAEGAPWWAPPDLLTPEQLTVLGLLAAASMTAAFVNTLFTQTVKFAADDFGVGDTGVGIAGSLVRAGIVLVLPLATLADRRGRRSIVVGLAVAAPLVTAAGALAPSFPILVATQAVGRPLGLALDFLVAVVAAEEMPRNSRAYAVSVLAMASGIGAGVAVSSLPLADVSPSAWRFVYLVTLVWLFVAVDIARRLPETRRFARPHVVAPRLDRRRFGVLATMAVLGNVFVAPASLFQNGYLKDIRGFNATTIAIFTLVTATPAGLGLVIGGRIADLRGRRRMIAVGLPLAAAFLVLSYSIGGPVMWASVFLAGTIGGMTYPAVAVYRAEMFPTGNRGRAAGLLTAAALVGGIGGLLATGWLVDAGHPYGRVMGGLALAQIAVVVVALTGLPETAHRELEDLNPEDRPEIVIAP